MNHLLLNDLNFKQIRLIDPLPGFEYDKTQGAWLSKINGSLLVNHQDFMDIASKKKDVEIGEDQK
jgi:hypothetical protein